ncbi:A-kinase anchor protein 9-like isoform X3 [Sitophilus oryzae]|uniref:A-kinase anchor protein 9-like isoform X3 n=1 Tax=Sitophilus oryzae TaxID=7048 RepID=A0A6J2XUG0_SITOR|nr:A-kinase anchor protein 9-like isoform X3 [Sitophilus oryzae]
MDESEESNVEDSNKTDKVIKSNSEVENEEKTLSVPNKDDADEEHVSESSISEHITSTNGSVENDRSLQEIEIQNHSALENVESAELLPDSDGNLFSNSFSADGNEFLENLGISQTNDNKINEPKNSKSILEELLVNSQIERDNEQSKEESFNMFANVDFSDKSLLNSPSLNDRVLNIELTENKPDNDVNVDIEKRVRQLEEIVAVKDSTINAISQELDSFREMSNPTYTLSMLSATEYKHLQEECQAKLLEYNSAIIYKNDLIQQLSESLDQSVSERKELLNQVELFKEEIAQLQTKLQETAIMVKEHQCAVPQSDKIDKTDNVTAPVNLEDSSSNCDDDIIIKLKNEISNLNEKIQLDKDNYEKEISRLRELLENVKCGSTELTELKVELENKHTKEVEELRTYFEKKCVELEKNYSEEIFSQQSRKMSDSSSDVELSNDFLLSNQPGPGGDHSRVIKSKEDIEKLKENLTGFLNKLSKHSLEELSDKDVSKIELEVKNELNLLLRIGEKLEIKAIGNKYLEEISNLKFQLEESRKDHGNMSIGSVIQEVGSSGDFEINEVIESYERRLQEQVNLAKIDLVNELVEQIQRLVSNAADEEEWPSELLQLRDRFVEKYESEIRILKEEHQKEIANLKGEHLKLLNGAIERARRRSLKDDDSISKSDTALLKERDNLKKQVISLRNLLSELLRYFTQAEDALNNTLVDELLRQGIDKNSSNMDDELNLDTSSGTTNSSKILDSLTNVPRVHLTPNFSELINMIEHQSQNNDSSIDISEDLKNELGMCLDKLRQEANAILTLTTNLPRVQPVASPRNSVDDKLNSLSKKLNFETLENERLKQELSESNDAILTLMEKIRILESELEQAKYKIAELVEDGRREVVSEGYGEDGSIPLPELDDAIRTLSDLQERARTMMAQSRASINPDIFELIEQYHSVGLRVKQGTKREKNDMIQQIEAADKKYKTTQKFLEEQAVEREQERDEAQRKINELYEQLKDRDKDRANYQMMSKEHHVKFGCRSLEVEAYKKVEQLEHQLQGLAKQIHNEQHRSKELEQEQEESLEKIRILREIIRDLEQQNDEKDRKIEQQLRNVEKLEYIQGLRRHVDELEQEVQQLRIGAELAGSEGAVRQIKLQLFELEVNLDKKTRELELLHSTDVNNSCSTPSEDMSVRDLVRPQTPNSIAMDECEVPLQQLARLKEKLLKHTRAEEAAMKRIKDLDMQVIHLKNETEEAQNEKEYMKRQIQEQLVLISDLQIRLDHQRIKAEHIEKQTNTSLESKIYDLQNEILTLQEKLSMKDKALNYQEQLVKEAQERIRDLETDIASAKDDDMIVEMQKELETLRQENHQMKERLSTENHILPNLVENIIADKNADIEMLRNKLKDTEKCLNSFTSLNVDKNDLKILENLKNSGGSIENLISILDLSQPIDQIRRMENSKQDSLSGLHQFSFKKSANDTELIEPEISSIERIGPSNLNYTVSAPLGKPNSTELGHKKVHFEDHDDFQEEINRLTQTIEMKDKTIREYVAKIKMFDEFEEKIQKLQEQLDETEQALNSATKTFEKEQNDAEERERMLGVELAEKKLKLSELEKEVQTLKEDSVRKDEMSLVLARDKKSLEQKLMSLKKDNFDNITKVIGEKNDIIEQMQSEKDALLEDIGKTQSDLKINKVQVDNLSGLIVELNQAKSEIETNLSKISKENGKLRKELGNKSASLENALIEAKNWREANDSSEKELKKLRDNLKAHEDTIKDLEQSIKKKDALVLDKDCDIEILNEDMKYYQTQLTELENKIKTLENPMKKAQLDQELAKVSELTKEVARLQDLVKEKERVITQMAEDHSQVHSNLKAIDNKIKETGNIFDLSGRLKREQKKNAELLEEIHALKAKLLNYEVQDSTPVDDITGQLKKELECAAQIDSNIISAVSDQSLSSISEGHDVEAFKKSLTRQKSHNKQLLRDNDKLEREKVGLEKLCYNLQQRLNEVQILLEKERMVTKETQLEDAKLMEQLRIKLDATLDTKEELEKVLAEEKHCRRALEIQIEELKKIESPSSESTKYKPPPTTDFFELNRLQRELDAVKEEKLQLVTQIKSLRQENDQLGNDVKYTKEMLKLLEERNRAQEEKFRVLSEKEKALTDEVIRKNFELEVKGREVEEKKIKMDELEQEKVLLKKQKSDLLRALKSQTSLIPSLDTGIPDALESAIRELKEKNEENKRRLEYIEKIENEKKYLENQLRNETINNGKNNMPFSDLVARCDYLFSKALKLESVRKALIWQKRYLVDYLQSHQRHCLVAVLPNQPHENYCMRHRHTPLEHFRSAVIAVISIHRMKLLVKRWHSGIRKSERINSRYYERSRQRCPSETTGPTAAYFHVGQPVSNNNFTYKPTTRSNNPFAQEMVATDNSRPVSPSSVHSTNRDIPWSGNTPPSKENVLPRNFFVGSSSLAQNNVPLRAPQLMVQYQERFEQIQEKLGVPFSQQSGF